ncbi:MFS transporter [Aureimonas endophytica]|uniref:MFS transporter n=1 Tax=Aureimonas endophytica TaxID=2027858 RepID=A0A917E8J6_9HYPH|nr:MFS transporter [Aureimonas endophytica]GGE13810.1 MFS transporter [Aureimonas endophytica]
MSLSATHSPARPSAPLAPPVWIERGSRDYGRVGLALFLAGFSTFSLLYCVQPLLPEFARSFAIGPAESALALSLTTGFLAFAIFLAGALSQTVPRRGLMFASMAAAAILNFVAALAPNWHAFLAARALEGLVLGGVPAVAMAYLAEEIDPRHLGRSMGLYVAGTAFGAMMGRVGMGVLTEIASWQTAMALLGLVDLAAAVGFALLLPASRNFVARRGLDARHHAATWGTLLRHRPLLRLYGVGFVLTSVFVTLFNYASFRLSEPPYGLGQTAISLIFLVYGFGMFASSLAGGLADRFGRRPALAAGLALMAAGILLTLLAPLPLIAAGIVLVTIGFFTAHSVASGWVGRLAGASKSHAASLYLLFYYVGSSVTGSVGGWFWEHGGWPAVVGLTGALALAGLALALGIADRRAA